MKILFKYPTRGRPAWFIKTLDLYIRLLSGKHNCVFLIAMDTDDETMNTPLIVDYLAQLKQTPLKENVSIEYYYQSHKGKADAFNSKVDTVTFDILVPISDDVEPMRHSYDDIIAKDMVKCWPLLDGAITYYCGKGRINRLASIPIFGCKLYKALGYVCHPDFFAWGDKHMTVILKNNRKVIFFEDILLRHYKSKYSNRDATNMRAARHRIADARTFNRLNRGPEAEVIVI